MTDRYSFRFFLNRRLLGPLLCGAIFIGSPTAISSAAEEPTTILRDRYPTGTAIDLIGGFTNDAPKEPGEKLFSSIRFEGDWLVSCEVSFGRMVQYANFTEGSRMHIRGEVARHTTFGMELMPGCELELSDTQ